MPQPTCPHCRRVLTELNTKQNRIEVEWGSVELPALEGDIDWGDSETVDTENLEYSCPHCDHRLTWRQVERLDQIAEGTAERPNTNTDNDGEGPRMNTGRQHRRFKDRYVGSKMVECPHCKHTYEDDLVAEMICPACTKVWTPPEGTFKEITIHQDPPAPRRNRFLATFLEPLQPGNGNEDDGDDNDEEDDDDFDDDVTEEELDAALETLTAPEQPRDTTLGVMPPLT